MPKIERQDDRSKPKVKAPAGDSSAARSSQKTEETSKGFLNTFLATRKESALEQLDRILKQIDAQSEVLTGNLTFGTLARYKELVRQFLTIALKDIYNVSTREVVDSKGKKKAMLVVEKVNKALDQLTMETIESQGKIISFMARLDEIRGMLVDLYS